jgi:hypothetical protein
MLFQRPWASLSLLAGSLSQSWGIGLSEHPDVKAISVGCADAGNMAAIDVLIVL